MIMRVPAAASQLNLKVGRVDAFPEAVCRCSPGHWKLFVGAPRRCAIAGIWLRLKMRMISR
jgi:hypothetical protein